MADGIFIQFSICPDIFQEGMSLGDDLHQDTIGLEKDGHHLAVKEETTMDAGTIGNSFILLNLFVCLCSEY
jgi:hypothetical protein